MKKMIAVLLTLVLLIGTVPTYASTNNNEIAVETLRAMGIINGDADGTVRLTQLIRRAEFAQVLVNASGLKTNPTGTLSTSVFADVKYDHWAAGAIRTATQNGWVNGFLDGTYRPDQFVTYEEAATSILKMLGYTSQDFYGNTPEGAILKFSELSLDEGVNSKIGDNVNRENMMIMIYNMMHTSTKEGNVYGETLGYSIPLDYAQIVDQNTKGPFITTTGFITNQLPFTVKNTIVYRNGSVTTLNSVKAYDVYYYNQNLKTVWVYSKKVTGIYSEAIPSIASPTSVTVSGNTYNIGASLASHKLSNTGNFQLGTAVTLLLGKNGEVVDVVTASTTEENGVGVVLSYNKQTYTDGVGKMFIENVINWVSTDGTTHETIIGDDTFSKGDLVSVTWTSGEAIVKELSTVALTGNVNASGTKIGNLNFAEAIEIIDVTPDGQFTTVYTSRLKDATLGYADVKYYSTDASGKINKLILNNLTGDLNTYGVVTNRSESTVVIPSSNPVVPDTVNQTGVYEYSINGVAGVKQTSGYLIDVALGPVYFTYKDGQVDGFMNLGGFNVTSLTQLTASNEQTSYPLADDVQVYQQVGSTYYQVNLKTILNTNDFYLMAYYDSGYDLGGKVRVIIAVEKSE